MVGEARTSALSGPEFSPMVVFGRLAEPAAGLKRTASAFMFATALWLVDA
jgi:hypothetical protein